MYRLVPALCSCTSSLVPPYYPYPILSSPRRMAQTPSKATGRNNTSTKTRKSLFLRLLPPFFSLPPKCKFNAFLSWSRHTSTPQLLKAKKKATTLDSVREVSITKRRERSRRNLGWRSWNLIKGGGRRQWMCVCVCQNEREYVCHVYVVDECFEDWWPCASHLTTRFKIFLCTVHLFFVWRCNKSHPSMSHGFYLFFDCRLFFCTLHWQKTGRGVNLILPRLVPRPKNRTNWP